MSFGIPFFYFISHIGNAVLDNGKNENEETHFKQIKTAMKKMFDDSKGFKLDNNMQKRDANKRDAL